MGALDDIKKINAEINKLRREMGSKPLKPFDQKDLEAAKYSLEGIRAEVREMGNDLDYVSKSFKDSVNELSVQNQSLKESKKSLSGISDIARKIVDYRRGESSLSISQLKTLQDQARVKFESLKNELKSGRLSEDQTNEIQQSLDKQEMFDESVRKTITHQKQVNKEIGLVGQGIGGISKALKKAGFGDLSQPLQDAIDKTKNARLQQKLNNDQIQQNVKELKRYNKPYGKLSALDKERKKSLLNQNQSLKSQNKELTKQSSKYKNIGKALIDQVHKFNVVDFLITAVVDGLLGADKATEDLARGLGMSMDSAHEMRDDFADIANSANNINISTKSLQESQLAMAQAVGTRAQLNSDDLETMTNMVKAMGFQHDELIGIEKLSLSTGKSLDDNTKEILGGARAYASRNKLVLNEKQILKEVNKMSSSLKLSLGGSGEAMAEAAAQAKQFGINLEKAESMASSLLDFESSIESELSAELLTGKNLNLERARGLALAGKSTEAAAAMLEQVGTAKEFGDMNVIAQEALAKAVGMTRDGLAESLIESEALAAMSGVEGENALERYNNELARGKSKQDMIDMLGEEAAKGLEAQSNQSKFNAMVEKLKDIFIQVGDALMPVFDILGSVFEIVGPIAEIIGSVVGFVIDWGKYLLPVVAAFVTLNAITKGYLALKNAILLKESLLGGVMKKNLLIQGAQKVASIGAAIPKIISGAWTTFGPVPFVGALLAAGAAAAGVAYLMSSSKKGNDVFSPGQGGGGYGNRTLMGPEGAISLNNKDTVIAGTNLGGKKQPQPQSGGTSVNVDMSQTNALLQQLISAYLAGSVINIDGEKVADALSKLPKL